MNQVRNDKPVFTQEEEAGFRLLMVRDDGQFRKLKLFGSSVHIADCVVSRLEEAGCPDCFRLGNGELSGVNDC